MSNALQNIYKKLSFELSDFYQMRQTKQLDSASEFPNTKKMKNAAASYFPLKFSKNRLEDKISTAAISMEQKITLKGTYNFICYVGFEK